MTKQEWNNFILALGGSFLQSWEWSEFQERVGKSVFRFSGEEWVAQFIKNKLPGVNKFYWHCPRGPVVANSDWPIANSKIQEIIEQIKKSVGKDVIFFRLGPEWELANSEGQMANSKITSPQPSPSKGEGELLKKLGFKQLPYDIEPSQTLILDITKSEDELLAQMHEKWRYNIRLAERKGVQVKFTQSDCVNFEQYFEEFYRLVSEGTAERKNIRHYPKEYYRKQLMINTSTPPNPPLQGGQAGANFYSPLTQRPASLSLQRGERAGGFKIVLFIAEYKNKVIAANIVVLFGGRATYLHGATSSEHREVMAPHLLQWEQIKYAKSQGCAEYDFWGIVNEHTIDKRGKSWEGFTRFKRGCGGRKVNYVGYWDYPLNKPWYFLYRLVQKFRR